jgi:hypothetical protein
LTGIRNASLALAATLGILGLLAGSASAQTAPDYGGFNDTVTDAVTGSATAVKGLLLATFAVAMIVPAAKLAWRVGKRIINALG